MNGKIYLAGPDVFYPNCLEIGENLKAICQKNGYIGMFPLDNVIEEKNTKKEMAIEIVKGNMNLIKNSDYVFANLSNFRGSKIHPMCDSGTAWECGYAKGLGKKVVAYTYDINAIPKDMKDKIDCIIELDENETFNSVFEKINKEKIEEKNRIECEEKTYNLDPEFDDIKDADSYSAFALGILCALNKNCICSLKDKRTQQEKYGIKDENGFEVENFDCCVNIMIEINSKII